MTHPEPARRQGGHTTPGTPPGFAPARPSPEAGSGPRRRGPVCTGDHAPLRTRGVLGGAVILASIVGMLLSSCATTLSREEIATEYYNIGSAYFELGDLEKSARYLSRAIELEPELARASYNLARVYVQQERYGEAVDLLELLLEEDPRNALVMETLGFAYYEQAALEEAARWFDRALEVNPTDVDLLQNRATVALQADDPQAAAAALERALEIVEDDARIYLRFARAQVALGELDGAATSYASYRELAESPSPEALEEYAGVLEDLEFYADSLSVLEDILASGGAAGELQARVQFTMARILLTEAGESESGVETLRAALAAGFSDREAIEALLEHPDLVASEEVASLIEESGVLEEQADEDEGRDGLEPVAPDESVTDPAADAPEPSDAAAPPEEPDAGPAGADETSPSDDAALPPDDPDDDTSAGADDPDAVDAPPPPPDDASAEP